MNWGSYIQIRRSYRLFLFGNEYRVWFFVFFSEVE